jgi:hypothetical protein
MRCALIQQLLRILLAYALALVPQTLAGIVLELDPGNHRGWVNVCVTAATVAALFTAVPALAIIGFCECFGRRSAATYVWSGIAIGVLTSLLLGGSPFGELARRHIVYVLGIGAGAMSGLIYWAIAGRTAGRWRMAGQNRLP